WQRRRGSGPGGRRGGGAHIRQLPACLYGEPGRLPCRAFVLIQPPTTEIYTLSLHDALPISHSTPTGFSPARRHRSTAASVCPARDRKSTRLNSSHRTISYAVFCLKKKTVSVAAIVVLFRPLMFSSSLPEVAEARGVRARRME